MLSQQSYTRPSYVSLQAGGRQDFPKDDVLTAKLHREAVMQAKSEGRSLTRRIPKEEAK